MAYYFEDYKSIFNQSNGNIEHTLNVMAHRYIGENPISNYKARAFTTAGIMRNSDYRYVFDGNTLFPDAKEFSYVYLWGKIRRESEGSLRFLMKGKSPFKVWLNGKEIFASTFETERYEDKETLIDLPVTKGYNHLVIRFTKTRGGFGGEFGTWLGKLDYYFMHGLHSMEEMEGFDYTSPFENDVLSSKTVAELPNEVNPVSIEEFEKLIVSTPLWSDKEKALGDLARIFQSENIAGKTLIARSSFVLDAPCKVSAQSSLAHVFIDSNDSSESNELFSIGRHEVLATVNVPSSYKAGESLALDVTLKSDNGEKITLINPLLIENTDLPWLYAGAFEKSSLDSLKVCDFDTLVGEGEEKTWWRLDIKGGWVRLYNENALYGHWDYPLGVTLYGLIETARLFEKNGVKNIIGEYVTSHVAKAVKTLDYALFDKQHFGGATAVHHLLTSIDSLDDCGSFGSLMLEVAKDRDIGDYAHIALYVGEYITKKQARLEDGCFWRKQMMHKFHNGTMWADDLYMSVPFLCRYAAFAHDSSILDDAAQQFIGFKKRLFMSDKKLMAHVYDFNRDMNTGVPWGRGNGWTIFSLTELLAVLPKDHAKRAELEAFYNELAEGFLAVQGEDGMWRQVLNDPKSYPESSCTSMFICAFSRGIRAGYLKGDIAKYTAACSKAYRALEKIAIDKAGNLYGVCRGSEFAFNPKYYSEHLLPQLNNTHGIGITLLAGVEMKRLQEFSK